MLANSTPADAGLDRARYVQRIRDEVRSGEYSIDAKTLAVAMVRRMNGSGVTPSV